MNYNILDFKDGEDFTEAFRKCAEMCRDNGGGEIYVPSGIYNTRSIRLYSNTTLNLEGGSRICFSNDIEAYKTVYSRWEGESCEVYMPLVFSENAENVCIKGTGVLDGNGSRWWQSHLNGELQYPRPRFVCFQNCKNVKIESVTIVNSPAWTINPILCDNVLIDRISITNPKNSPNTDGINPESCSNVRVFGCYISVGDDCVTLKSGIECCNELIPLKNVVISGCTMQNGHGGVVIGSEMSGGVENVTVTNCTFENTDRGIRIKTRRGRGGYVRNLMFSDIIMSRIMCPFVINMYYYCGKSGRLPIVSDKSYIIPDETTPHISNIQFNNIIATDITSCAGYFYGLKESPIKNVVFRNVTIKISDNPKSDYPAMMEGCPAMKGEGIFEENTDDLHFIDVNIH